MSMGTIKAEVFGKTPDGVEVHVFTLTNSKGVEARIINYGGIAARQGVSAWQGVAVAL